MKDLEFVSWLPTNFINRKHFWADFCCIKVSNYTGLSKWGLEPGAKEKKLHC